MAAPIPLRTVFTADDLRIEAQRTRHANQAPRLLALVAIYDDDSHSDAAWSGGVGLQIVRDWVLRFNATGGDKLIGLKARGATPKLNDEQRSALGVLIEQVSVPAVHSVVHYQFL